MDIIEINKLTQKKKVDLAEKKMLSKDISKDEALCLVISAVKQVYGIRATGNVIHGLGVKKIK